MRLSVTILFLGWLAQEWTLSRGQYPKPSISIRPDREILLGEPFSITCRGPYDGATFTIWKEEKQQSVQIQQMYFNAVVFTISSAQQTHAGKYMCWYCLYSGCSHSSAPISINVTEIVFQKPSLSVNSSEVVTLGESVSIHCKSEGFQNAEFVLQKSQYSGIYQTVERKTDEIQYRIVDIETSDVGIYQCRYCIKSNDSAFYQRCSNYSDSVYLNITGYWRSKPFIQITPSKIVSPGSNVTIECQGGPSSDPKLLLLKSNKVIAVKEAGQGTNSTKFHLFRVRPEDAGNYTCHYYKLNQFIWSVPSDPAELHLTDNSQRNPPSLYFASLEIWIRLGVGAVVVFALVVILAEAAYSWRTEQRFLNID